MKAYKTITKKRKLCIGKIARIIKLKKFIESMSNKIFNAIFLVLIMAQVLKSESNVSRYQDMVVRPLIGKSQLWKYWSKHCIWKICSRPLRNKKGKENIKNKIKNLTGKLENLFLRLSFF